MSLLKLTLVLSLVACGASAGSMDTRHGAMARSEHVKQPENVRRMLLAELREQIAAWPRPEPLRENQITWSSDRSVVVPGLYYYVADFRPHGAGHGVAQAVAGVRGSKSLLLGTQQSWAELTEQWSPSDEAQVIAACREFIRAAGRSRIRANVPRVLTRESFAREGLHPDLSTEFHARQGTGGPTVTRNGSTWRSEMWVPEVRLGYTLFAMRYGCTFATVDSTQRTPTLSVLDSIPGLAAPVE